MNALLTVDEAAAQLRCSRSRVFELLADGTLTRGPKFGQCTTVTPDSVARAVASPPPERPRIQRVGQPIGGRVGR